jgi:tRNA pseudouridine55 synthase
VLNISKPRGVTSHQMVALVRRLFHQKRVGHAGTLDPLAEGVLPVLLGRATRLADQAAAGVKVYYAEILLGTVTSTDDLEGEIISTAVVPEYSDAEVRAVLDQFTGEIEQVPPMYSAVKLAGEAAYRRARRGEQVEIRPRRIRIDRIRLVSRTQDHICIVVRCGKGTYIRSLARDIGERLGPGATLARLVRLRVGPFHICDSVSPEELDEARESERLASYLMPSDAACNQLPAIVLDDERSQRAMQGQGWQTEPGDVGPARVYTSRGAFLGLARREADHDDVPDRAWWRLRVMVDGA